MQQGASMRYKRIIQRLGDLNDCILRLLFKIYLL